MADEYDKKNAGNVEKFTNGVIDGIGQGVAAYLGYLGKIPDAPYATENNKNPFGRYAKALSDATHEQPYEGTAYDLGVLGGQQVPSAYAGGFAGKVYSKVLPAYMGGIAEHAGAMTGGVSEGAGIAANEGQPYEAVDAAIDALTTEGVNLAIQGVVDKYLNKLFNNEIKAKKGGFHQKKNTVDSGEREEDSIGEGYDY